MAMMRGVAVQVGAALPAVTVGERVAVYRAPACNPCEARARGEFCARGAWRR